MAYDDYEDDDFGDDLHDEDEFGEDSGFSELDPDEDDDPAAAFLAEHDPTGEGAGAEHDGDDAEIAQAAFDEIAAGASPGDEQLAWRETYFLLFQRHQRPTLTQVEAAIGQSSHRLSIDNLQADDDGYFQSVLIQAPEDNAALEISFEQGEAVIEQSAELAKNLQGRVEGEVLAQLLRSDARLDVLHFERVEDGAPLSEEIENEAALEALNPATLISVIEALAELTDGVAIDPTTGELML